MARGGFRAGPAGAADREAVAAPAPAGDDLAERYLWYLEVGGDALAEALTLLGSDEHYPLVFHCAAGKDRTGVLAALVLDLCGVARDDIVADYVITAERMGFIMDRYRADPRFAERVASVYVRSTLPGLNPSAARTFSSCCTSGPSEPTSRVRKNEKSPGTVTSVATSRAPPCTATVRPPEASAWHSSATPNAGSMRSL